MPTPGFQPGPDDDKVTPGRFFIDPPTIHNLGFRWYIEGPDHKGTLLDVRNARHVHVEDLTFRRARVAIHGGNKGDVGAPGLVVRRCTIEDVVSGIWTYSENSKNWFVADNVLVGMNPTWHPRSTPERGYMEPSHTGVNVYGRGHVIAYNLILGGTGSAISTGSITPYTTLDYNGYRRNNPDHFIRWFDGETRHAFSNLSEFAETMGYERHGIELDYDSFVQAEPPERGETAEPHQWDLRLRPESPAVNAGLRLPNINDDFTGDAPDLGAHELGRPMPHYGPREEGP